MHDTIRQAYDVEYVHTSKTKRECSNHLLECGFSYNQL